MKSKYIGEIVNNFLILEMYYELNSNNKKTSRFKLQCIYCDKIQSRSSSKVTHGNVKCDCQKNFKNRGCDRNCRLGRIYHGMLQRCENSNKDSYEYYGGKGITVCEEWQTYEPFMEWSLKNGYNDDLSIDRIDYNKGYSPENCRWADNKIQSNNKSNNHYLTYNNQTKTVQQWGEFLGIKPNSIITRLRRGWSLERALLTPTRNT